MSGSFCVWLLCGWTSDWVCVVTGAVSALCVNGAFRCIQQKTEVSGELLCPSASTPTGIHLAVWRSVTPHRKTLMDSPWILPFLLSPRASPLCPPASICLPSAQSSQLPRRCHVTPRSHFDFTRLPQPLHLPRRSCLGSRRQGVWLSGYETVISATKHKKIRVSDNICQARQWETADMIWGAFWAGL